MNQASPILFVASPPPKELGEDGKPGLATIDPIAFVSNGQLFECIDWTTQGDTVPARTLRLLRKAYAPGNRYQLWWRGAPVGATQIISSCIGEEDISEGGAVDLHGCVRYTSAQGINPIPVNSSGIVFTGKQPIAAHQLVRGRANPSERREFLQLALQAYAKHDSTVTLARIHASSIWKTQLRHGRAALVGNSVVQIPAKKPRTYHSYRIFLAAEESTGTYVPVLTQFHEATIELDADTEQPKAGEELDEENSSDKEVFIDNFPLFPSEADAIITEHTYYESSAYSVYRRVGANYQLLYTGCGGGT